MVQQRPAKTVHQPATVIAGIFRDAVTTLSKGSSVRGGGGCYPELVQAVRRALGGRS